LFSVRKVQDSSALEGARGAERLQQALADTPPQRILLIGRDQIGDLVNTTGAISALTERFPDAEFILEVGEYAAPLFDNFPRIGSLWRRKKHQGLKGKMGYVMQLRREKLDLAVILDDSNEKVRLAYLGNVPIIVGVRRNKHHDMYTASVPFDEQGHDLFTSLEGVLSLIGGDFGPDPIKPKLYPSESDREAVEEILKQIEWTPGHSSLAVHIGASDQKKQWPPGRFAELINRLWNEGHRPLLIGGPEDQAALAEVRSQGPQDLPFLATPLSLLQLAVLFEKVGVLVTNDSGPAHLAAAMGSTCVVFYGPTRPSRYRPYGDRHVLLYHPNDCELYAYRCVRETEKKTCDRSCISLISVEEALEATLSVLADSEQASVTAARPSGLR
jgi:ADP-heptose:LPS heptosyltransferase